MNSDHRDIPCKLCLRNQKKTKSVIINISESGFGLNNSPNDSNSTETQNSSNSIETENNSNSTETQNNIRSFIRSCGSCALDNCAIGIAFILLLIGCVVLFFTIIEYFVSWFL